LDTPASTKNFDGLGSFYNSPWLPRNLKNIQNETTKRFLIIQNEILSDNG